MLHRAPAGAAWAPASSVVGDIRTSANVCKGSASCRFSSVSDTGFHVAVDIELAAMPGGVQQRRNRAEPGMCAICFEDIVQKDLCVIKKCKHGYCGALPPSAVPFHRSSTYYRGTADSLQAVL